MPPASIRRPLSIGAVALLASGLLAAGPLLAALAALAHACGRPKPLLALRLLLAYCAHELGVVAACAGLWLLAGGGRLTHRPVLQRLHWSVLRWYVHGLSSRARSLLGIEVREHGMPQARQALGNRAPVIVLSRHAGPGDTILLVDRLACHYGRRPSVVLRQALTLDPAIDLLTSRLPHGVIDNSDGTRSEEVIERLAARLGPGGALLLYPEGGNFTPQRRRSALASLRGKGHRRAAKAAEQMANVLPPRPSGVVAALRGNPRADVVFVAHTGLGWAIDPRTIYRELPIGRHLHQGLWLVPAAEVPHADQEQTAWLNLWWQRVDAWVREQHAEPGC